MCWAKIRSGLIAVAALAAVSLWALALPAAAATPPKGQFGKLVAHKNVHLVKPPGAGLLISPSSLKRVKGTLLSDGFEGDFPGAWAPYNTPYFAPTTYRKFAGAKSAYCAQGGTGAVAAPGPYPNDFTGWITYGPFSLAEATGGKATFKLWNVSEQDYDVVFAGWSLDDNEYEGTTWSGTTDGWITTTVNMADASYTKTYVGQSQVYFSFYFRSDTSTTAEGAYLDDVALTTVTSDVTTQNATGTIKDQFGRPVHGAVVTASGAGGGTAYTGWDGKYLLKLAPGTYTLTPRKPGCVFVPVRKTITVVAGTGITADFAARTAVGDGVVKSWAVLVGIADYVGTSNDLNYCDDDARDMKASLMACGWPEANIATLIDAQGTKAGIRGAISAMAAKADADDVCLFFQSSHGGQGSDRVPLDEPDGMDEYLCTYNINTETINDDELGVWLSALKTPKYLVLVDACYSGGLLKSAGKPSGFSFAEDIVGARASGQLGTRDVDDNGAGVVVSSCRDNELSQEDSSIQNGVFAYYVCQGIDTGKADANADGWISAEECYNYGRPLVTMNVADQTLDLYDGYPGELNFAQLPTIIQSSTPAAKAVRIPRNSKITLTFRNPVNQASAQSRFRLRQSNGKILPGAFTWTTAKKTLQFTPTALLRSAELYSVTIMAGLVLDDGTTMPRAESFTFRCGSATAVAGLALTGTAATTASGNAQIMVSLSAPATVSGSICNLAGREIAQLPTSSLEKGLSNLLWSGKSAQGTKVPAGQYLVRLKAVAADGGSATCLMALHK